MTAKLHESATLTAKGAKRRIRLISEGQGSSGLYEGAMLQRDGETAFPAGVHIYLDHLTEDEDAQRGGSHSVKDLVGVTLTPAVFEDGALNADAQFFSNWATLIEEIKDHVDLSIEAAGAVNEGVVEALHYSPFNAVSIVPRGGRDGKILGLIESARESGKIENVKPGANNVQEDAGKDKGMTPEQIAALQEALVTSIKSAFGEIKESLVPAKPADEETDAPNPAEVAEALVVSGLPAEARARVYESLKNDPDFEKAIADEKAYVDSVRESLKAENEDDSVLHESHKNFEPRVGGW